MLKSSLKICFLLAILFFLAGLVAIHYSRQPVTPQEVANTIGANLEEEIMAIEDEAQKILEGLQENTSTRIRSKRDFSYFVYDRRQLLYWSDNNFVPALTAVSDTFTVKLLKTGSSDYLALKWMIAEQRFLVGIIPLYRKFNITNHYLNVEWNKNIFPPGNISILEPNATIGIPVCSGAVCPFKISFIQQALPVRDRAGIAAIVCISLAILMFGVGGYRALRMIRHPDLVFVLLALLLWGMRWLMTALNFPGTLVQNDLFNPQVFASSALNASLGDLLLNEITIFILCWYLFKNLFHFRSVWWLQQRRAGSWVLSILCGLGMWFAMLFPFVVIQTLYNNSAIILDISRSLDFDRLRVTALVAILLAGVCSFLFSHAFMRLLIGNEDYWRIGVGFLTAAGIFAFINVLTDQAYESSLLAGVFYFILVYGLKLYASLKRLSFTTFTYLFVSVFFLSANSAYAIQHFSREEKTENQFRFARNFLIERDYFGEYLLRELSGKISNDVFIQTRITTPFFSKDAVRQKIRQVFLPSYFNKYDVEIYMFNAGGESLDERSEVSFSGLVNTYEEDAFRTDYEKVYFVNSPSGDITQKYLVVAPIQRRENVAGYVVVELSLKRIIPENVYPELLVDNSFLQFYRSQEISYAVFANNKVLYSSGFLNYEGLFDQSWLGNTQLHTTGLHEKGYDHIAVEDESGRVAVVSSQSAPLTHTLANFSFLLVLGLVAVLMFILIQGFVNYFRGDKLYFSARIQLFLNMAFFVPLIIVSAVTLSVTNRSSQNQINEEYLSKAKKFSDQIAGELNRYQQVTRQNATSFENQLTDLAQLVNLDANVYNTRGILMATSQPLIFENNLISNYINARAIQRVRNGDHLFIETEKVGGLKYFIAYASLKAPSTGDLIGILGIPFFQSVYSLEKVQINILANILNIFALIFIALVVLSYFISQWLTFPLTFITQSLKKTSLTKTNQPLVWKADDEIGLMVKEYNQMLFKLSESKAELEQTQRERAWREIAQQVAHEIKNPLTPMKLTLQQLERAVLAGTHSADKTGKAIASLLTQVNTLNDIASSFSAFAKMPEPVIRRLELISLLRRIIDLLVHSGEVTLDTTLKEVFVTGDEQLLGRTFSNLILNAIQAARPGIPLKVYIKLDKTESGVILAFQDNGKGIEPEVAERIFVPHFTTKKSGSGLGLAIAKQAIEQMRGRIWFETQVGKGTTFFIELLTA